MKSKRKGAAQRTFAEGKDPLSCRLPSFRALVFLRFCFAVVVALRSSMVVVGSRKEAFVTDGVGGVVACFLFTVVLPVEGI